MKQMELFPISEIIQRDYQEESDPLISCDKCHKIYKLHKDRMKIHNNTILCRKCSKNE